jgi:hypothetical protein
MQELQVVNVENWGRKGPPKGCLFAPRFPYFWSLGLENAYDRRSWQLVVNVVAEDESSTGSK